MVANRGVDVWEYYATVFRKDKVFKFLFCKMPKIHEVQRYAAEQSVWYGPIYAGRQL